MIDETIAKLEARLQNSPALSEQNRAELMELLGRLKTEASALSQTNAERAQQIVGHAEASTAAATSEGRREGLTTSLDDLARSVDGFENTHPRLVQVVNRLAETLSNLGI